MRSTPTTTLTALTLAALVLAPALPAQAKAGLPTACEETLRALHDAFALQRQSLAPAQAVAQLQALGGPACGFDLTGRTPPTVDPAALEAFVATLGPASPHESGPGRLVPDEPGVPAVPDPTRLAGGVPAPGELPLDGPSKAVPCAVPGSGPGSLDVKVLGVSWPFSIAAGSWTSTLDVTGSNGVFTGSQGVTEGVLSLGPLPLPTTGSTGVLCIASEVTTVVGQTCYGFPPFYQHCEEVTKTSLTFVPCAATAHQETLAGLVTAEHHYFVEDGTAKC